MGSATGIRGRFMGAFLAIKACLASPGALAAGYLTTSISCGSIPEQVSEPASHRPAALSNLTFNDGKEAENTGERCRHFYTTRTFPDTFAQTKHSGK